MTEARGGDAAGSLAEMLDERQHLLEIALWIFGSATTADRIVQETYRRWYALHDDERAAIAVPRAWLTRVAGGICLDLLASAATVQAPVIPPEPSSTTAPVVLSDRGGLVQPPALHQASDLDIRLGQRRPDRQRSTQTMLDRHARVVRRFAAACESGDTAALQAVLAPDAVVVNDGGGKVRAAARPVHGASEAARVVAAVLVGPGTLLAVESVNGRMGLVLRRAGRAVAVVSLSVAGSEVTAVWVVLNPDKLRSWHRP